MHCMMNGSCGEKVGTAHVIKDCIIMVHVQVDQIKVGPPKILIFLCIVVAWIPITHLSDLLGNILLCEGYQSLRSHIIWCCALVSELLAGSMWVVLDGPAQLSWSDGATVMSSTALSSYMQLWGCAVYDGCSVAMWHGLVVVAATEPCSTVPQQLE